MNALSPTVLEPEKNLRLAVSFQFILRLYLVIPMSFFIYLLDQTLWSGAIQARLPVSPSHFILFQILFGTPHIVASAILLLTNRDYVQCFKRKLVLASVLIGLIFGIGSLFIPYSVLYIATACWTVYHVFKQQHGIGKAVCHLPTWAFYWLLWLSVSAGIFTYLGIFLKNTLEPQQADWIQLIAGTLTIGLIFSSVLCQRYVNTLLGKYFLWSNTLLIVSSFYFYTQQYYFFAILVPRLVHDMTAYIFYVTHDYNKHHLQAQNFLYRYANRYHLSIFLVLPLLSFALTYLLQAYGDQMVNFIVQSLFGIDVYRVVTLGLIGYLSLMHYYTESFAWQGGSPLRRYIRFVKQ